MRYIERKICPVYPEGAKKDAYQPVLYGYLLERSPKLVHSVKRPAVIVCPGGAYRYKSEREGDPVAMRFLAAGIHAFVLQYSVAQPVSGSFSGACVGCGRGEEARVRMEC